VLEKSGTRWNLNSALINDLHDKFDYDMKDFR